MGTDQYFSAVRITIDLELPTVTPVVIKNQSPHPVQPQATRVSQLLQDQKSTHRNAVSMDVQLEHSSHNRIKTPATLAV